MLLRSLTLDNVGVYRGRQQISFATSASRPITLVGGKNGTGKTSLLDAIYLVLYGNRARWLFDGASYPEYLDSVIHFAERGSSIRLDFDLMEDGLCRRYSIKRMWSRRNKGRSTDQLYVTVNGEVRDDLAAAWPEFVESVMPMAVASLAIFDGERIATLADPASAAEMFRKSLYGLLGLDLVERLRLDLRSYRRRAARDSSPPDMASVNEELSGAEAAHSVAREDVDTSVQVLADLEGAKSDLKIELHRAQDALSRVGGSLFAEREELQGGLAGAAIAAEAAKHELFQLASTELPLSLVPDLLKLVVTAGEQSELSRLSTEMHSAFAARNERLVGRLAATLQLGAGDERLIRDVLQSDLNSIERPSDPTYSPSIEATSTARELAYRRLLELRIAARRSTQRLSDVESDAAAIERKLAAVPDAEVIADAVQRVATFEAEVRTAERAVEKARASLDEAERRASRARREVDVHAHRVLTADASNRDRSRVAREITAADDVLNEFANRVVRKHLGRITREIEQALGVLLRKSNLVTGICIDSKDLTITFRDSQAHPIDAKRLSAGERQIVATAILWGLLRSAGRDLPVVIDSPLGRLDNSHRTNLVESYFPHAARQVVLLSTDEEIVGEHLARLLPHVGAQYELDFDEHEACTSIQRSSALE